MLLFFSTIILGSSLRLVYNNREQNVHLVNISLLMKVNVILWRSYKTRPRVQHITNRANAQQQCRELEDVTVQGVLGEDEAEKRLNGREEKKIRQEMETPVEASKQGLT